MVKPFTYSFTGLLYGLTLAMLGWAATGAGHGTFFFFSLAVFPFGIGILLWPVITLLLGNAHDRFYRILFLVVIAGRYALIALYVLGWGLEELPRIGIAWKYSPVDVLASLIVFLGGQILIWLLFIRGLRQGE